MRASERRTPSDVLGLEVRCGTHLGGAVCALAEFAAGLFKFGAGIRIPAEQPHRGPVTRLPGRIQLIVARLCVPVGVGATNHPRRVGPCGPRTSVLEVLDCLQGKTIVEVPSTRRVRRARQQLAHVDAVSLVVPGKRSCPESQVRAAGSSSWGLGGPQAVRPTACCARHGGKTTGPSPGQRCWSRTPQPEAACGHRCLRPCLLGCDVCTGHGRAWNWEQP